jgi:hypothetical protein
VNSYAKQRLNTGNGYLCRIQVRVQSFASKHNSWAIP